MEIRYITVSGAYGRDYRSAEKALADWNKGLDFKILTAGVRGTYMSKRDVPKGVQVTIRYNKLRGTVTAN